MHSNVLAQLPNFTHREAKRRRMSSRSQNYKGQTQDENWGFMTPEWSLLDPQKCLHPDKNFQVQSIAQCILRNQQITRQIPPPQDWNLGRMWHLQSHFSIFLGGGPTANYEGTVTHRGRGSVGSPNWPTPQCKFIPLSYSYNVGGIRLIRVSKKLPKNSKRIKRPVRLSREGTVCGCALGSEIKWNLGGVQREETVTLRMVQRGKEENWHPHSSPGNENRHG